MVSDTKSPRGIALVPQLQLAGNTARFQHTSKRGANVVAFLIEVLKLLKIDVAERVNCHNLKHATHE